MSRKSEPLIVSLRGILSTLEDLSKNPEHEELVGEVIDAVQESIEKILDPENDAWLLDIDESSFTLVQDLKDLE